MTKRILVLLGLLSFLTSPMLHIRVAAVTCAQERFDASLIGELRNASVLDGCGCSLKRQGKNNYVFFGEITENKRARMNIDGRDVWLSFVSSTERARVLRKGERFVKKYSIDGSSYRSVLL